MALLGFIIFDPLVGWYEPHQQIHSTLQAICAIAGLLYSYHLLLSQSKPSPYNTDIQIIGFIGMGIMSLAMALYWSEKWTSGLQGAFYLCGGICSAGAWVFRNTWLLLKNRRLMWYIFPGWLIISFTIQLSVPYIPLLNNMLDLPACHLVIALLSGLLFMIAGISCWRWYWSTQQSMSFVMAVSMTTLAAAALAGHTQADWDEHFWLQQVLAATAFILLLIELLRSQSIIANQLAISEARLGDIAEVTSDWIWEASIDWKYTYCGSGIHKSLGYTAEEVLGCTPFDLMPEEESGRVRQLFEEVKAARGRIVNLETKRITKDGTLVWLENNALPILSPAGDIIGYRGADSDITIRKHSEHLLQRNEELARSNAELDDFAYIASHDLKEPLRGISNYASFLAEDYRAGLDEEGLRMLDALPRLAQRLERFLDDLLRYSRVGRLELAYEDVDLEQVIEETLGLLAATLAERSVEVIRPMPLPVFYCDRARISEVFLNLISNASKYNDREHKTIEIGWQKGQPHYGDVFYIRDNGIGIPSQHLDKVFSIFKRLHARDKYGGGTGAGLTITKKIIERHQGKIWLESEVGIGTTFFFTLSGGQHE